MRIPILAVALLLAMPLTAQQQSSQQAPPAEPHFDPNCSGCIQVDDSDGVTIIKAQRAMLSLQQEWQEQVKKMNERFGVQQKIISDKVAAIKKEKKVPENYLFDYQNLQFAPAPKNGEAKKEKGIQPAH